jgi:hypothetical protein
VQQLLAMVDAHHPRLETGERTAVSLHSSFPASAGRQRHV